MNRIRLWLHCLFRFHRSYVAHGRDMMVERGCFTCFTRQRKAAPVINDPQVDHAYRDAEGWVLFNKGGEPVEWPSDWPDVIDVGFLQQRGIWIAL